MNNETDKLTFLSIVWTILRYLPAALWLAGAGSVLLLIYLSGLSQGMANCFPQLARKLSATLPFLARYEETRSLTNAHSLAALFFVIMIGTWEVGLRAVFGFDGIFQRFPRPDAVKRVVYVVMAVLLCGDLWFYYAGISDSGWGKVTLSPSALVATAVFVAINAAVILISLFLLPHSKKEEKDAL